MYNFVVFSQVLLKTTAGDIDIELWSKEAPKACRNFVQLCMEGKNSPRKCRNHWRTTSNSVCAKLGRIIPGVPLKYIGLVKLASLSIRPCACKCHIFYLILKIIDGLNVSKCWVLAIVTYIILVSREMAVMSVHKTLFNPRNYIQLSTVFI